MPPLLGQTWGSNLRPLSSATCTPSFSSCLRAVFSSFAPHASSDGTTIVSPQKGQLQHQHDSRDSQRRHKLADVPRLSPAEQERLRYQTDPEYRQRKIQKAKERYYRLRHDPEFRQKCAKMTRRWREDHKGDVEWYRRYVYDATKRHKDRRLADDAIRQKTNADAAGSNRQRYWANPQNRLYVALKSWYHRHRDHLSQFVWEHWQPIYFEEKIEKTCATCATNRMNATRINGRRFWVWIELSEGVVFNE